MPYTSPPIGARTRRFVLETPLDTPDGFGGILRDYAPGPQVWGALETVSGQERLRADRPEQVVTHKITLRYRAGITAAMRLSLGLRRFAIRAAWDPNGLRREILCLVEEIGA